MFDIHKQGDFLERQFADFICGHLSGYNRIWSEYIGNDGHNKLAHMEGLSKEEVNKRKLFSQYHYTCLESIICMLNNVEEAKGTEVPNLKEAAMVEQYIRLMNIFMVFHSHAGRIRDLIQKMGNQWQIPDLAKHLEEYYQRRNSVLHQSKAPIGFIDGVLTVLLPEGKRPDESKWGADRLWYDPNNTSIEFMNDYLAETFKEIVCLVNDSLESLYSKAIRPFLSSESLKLSNPPANSYYGSTTVSGVSASMDDL